MTDENRRLASKEPKELESAIVASLALELRLPPAEARELYEQIAPSFADFNRTPSTPGELSYIAVDADEPKSRPIADCRRVQVLLRLTNVDDAC